MNLSQALRLSRSAAPNPKSKIGNRQSAFALAGAGGKTTALFQLARTLPPPVIVTATTHLHLDQIQLADAHWIADTPADLNNLEANLHGVILVTGSAEGDRTKGLDDAVKYWLHAVCGYHDIPLLIEADGARQRPLKAPAEHEPVIPQFVDMVVVVAGLGGLGKPLTKEHIHRPEIFAGLSGLEMGQEVTAEAVVRVLAHPAGGLKGIPENAQRVVLLNQADTPDLQAQGNRMAIPLLKEYDAVLIAALQPQMNTDEHGWVYAIHEKVAGIILAAGEAKRYGKPKQLLEWRGKPFVRHVAETALAAGLSPVIVVTGAHAEQVEVAIRDLLVTIVRNEEWRSGQGSSIRAGMEALTPHPGLKALPPPSPAVRERGEGSGVGGEGGAAIFLLADQPQVSAEVIRALVERHSLDLSPIVAPQVQGQRANPVLFDRVTFPALMSLSGDVGGRALFPQFPVTPLPWHDENLLLDIDTPADYERLRRGA